MHPSWKRRIANFGHNRKLIHLPEAGICCAKDSEVRWDHSLYVGHTFDVERLEDDGDGLDHHVVMLREGRITDYLHQKVDGDGWIELFQGAALAHQLTHVDLWLNYSDRQFVAINKMTYVQQQQKMPWSQPRGIIVSSHW